MKKLFKRTTAFLLALTLLLTADTLFLSKPVDVSAASNKPYINPYDANPVLTYKPGDKAKYPGGYYTTISIVNCSKKSQIKNLKSSNKNIKVEAKDGYIKAYFGYKEGKATITCTVNKVKLKTTLTVKKYSNPLKTFKIGKTNYTSKYKTINDYKDKKSYKKQKLILETNKNWVIRSVYVYSGSSTQSYRPNSTKLTKKVTLNPKNYDNVYIYLYNSKTKISERLIYRTSKY